MADDLARDDELHQRFAETLRSADFARYVALSHVSEESRHIDEELDGIFGMLEEATRIPHPV